MAIESCRAIFSVLLLTLLMYGGGCTPRVKLQFRYAESQKPVAGGEVVIRPSAAFADPLLPFKTKEVTTSADGEIELSLNWKPVSEAKAIEMKDPDGGFHQWCMGDREIVNPFHLDNWIGEQGIWVEGDTDTRKYQRVEVRLIEKE